MKIIVIGCGSIGTRHACNLARLGEIELLFYDVDPARSRSLAQKLEGMMIKDLDDGIASVPDAVLICTPTYLHVPLALEALQAGAHLFIEKPISHTLDGVDELISKAASQKRVILVGCNLRFHLPIVILKEWLDKGSIGHPLFGRFFYGNYLPNWRTQEDYRRTYSAHSEMGGGILLEGTHDIDYAQWFLGEPDMVSAMTGQVSQLEIDTDDIAEILVRFASGAMAEIHLDYLRPIRGRSCQLIGDEGFAIWQAEGKNPERSIMELHRLDGFNEQQTLDTDLNEMYIEEMRHFIKCIKGQEKPLVDGASAKRVLEIAMAAKTSSQTGRTVRLAE